MARTAEKVESLTDEDSAMADALAVVLEATGNGGEVQWTDVRDELSSGQWGRLIEKGVLVDGDSGFRLDDREAVESALDGTGAAPTATSDADDDIETTTWSQYDKGAALVSLGLFAGYTMQSVRDIVGGLVDVVLGPVDALLPFYAVVLVVALLTGLYSTLLQANLMDMDKMGQYQERMKAIQEKRKAAKERGDDEALDRIQDEQMEAMGDQMGMFKEQFRPMVWIMLLTIPLFLWMYWMIRDGHIAEAEQFVTMPLVGETEWTAGVIGPLQAWIAWYFVCSMSFTQVLRKSLNIDMSPT